MRYEELQSVSNQTRVNSDTDCLTLDLYDFAERLTYEQVREMMQLGADDERFDQ